MLGTGSGDGEACPCLPLPVPCPPGTPNPLANSTPGYPNGAVLPSTQPRGRLPPGFPLLTSSLEGCQDTRGWAETTAMPQGLPPLCQGAAGVVPTALVFGGGLQAHTS